MKMLVVPILLITLGVGWLLTTLGVVPQVDWVWTLGVALVGMLTFALGGFDKVTVVVGTFFLFASFLSILRQTGRLSVDIEIPVLVIAAGVLMLVAQFRFIPVPRWLLEIQEKPQMKSK
ncbi:MAG TPA: hypothetical protein VFW73_04270 [Lacipirellulaceae bacterium]|nr:hypothetical protein [Lacipirellulaceae bacterium]